MEFNAKSMVDLNREFHREFLDSAVKEITRNAKKGWTQAKFTGSDIEIGVLIGYLAERGFDVQYTPTISPTQTITVFWA